MGLCELSHFRIGKSYGGNQDWMLDPMMHLGGCGALTACDTCIVLAQQFGFTSLVPFPATKLTRRSYTSFGKLMKAYLPPRKTGIDRLDTFADEFGHYLSDRANETGERPVSGMRLLHKDLPWQEAAEEIRAQLQNGIPVPTLLLHHDDPRLKDYEYHWFLINGYKDTQDGGLLVRAVTYGTYEWLPFDVLWNPGRPDEDGGVVLIDLHVPANPE
ncbi:MAG: hypothetical protein IJ133_04185 [Clostridia bacterium]|nr:hypothetical protein [Clostridia bacterium]